MSETINSKEVEIDLVMEGVEYKGHALVEGSTLSYVWLRGDFNADTSGGVYHNGYRIGNKTTVLKWEALHLSGLADNNMEQCEITGYWAPSDEMVTLADCRRCIGTITFYFEEWGDYYLKEVCKEHRVRSEDDGAYYLYAPETYFEDMYYCDECDCYVNSDDWNDYYDCCRWCVERNHSIIQGYTESHESEVIYFGKYGREEDFQGLGFELEVDCSSENSRKNISTASNLCREAGLSSDEMRFAHDGSLNNGFECISQPHTVEDFWSKQDKWAKMLQYLASQGYRSHDTNTCGLHIHISRRMFGSTEKLQDEAIAKVYTFFDDNWRDLCLVSRRNCFDYCEKNQLGSTQQSNVRYGHTTKLKEWRKNAKREGGHYVALNNANCNTFEYRLGRGTLNPWSFFAWIDLIVTITKNAKRITVGKVNSNDLVSWLGGIKETTAKYIYKRGAFRSTMVALYPSIEWELSTVDNSND